MPTAAPAAAAAAPASGTKKRHRRGRRHGKGGAGETPAAAAERRLREQQAELAGRAPRSNSACWQRKGESFERHPVAYPDTFFGDPPAADFRRSAWQPQRQNPFYGFGW